MTISPPAPQLRTRMRGAAAALVAMVVLAVVLACAACGGGPIKLTGVTETEGVKRPIVNPMPQAVVGHLLGSIAERTIGPFLARIPNQGGVVAWVTPCRGQRSARRRDSAHGRGRAARRREDHRQRGRRHDDARRSSHAWGVAGRSARVDGPDRSRRGALGRGGR